MSSFLGKIASAFVDIAEEPQQTTTPVTPQVSLQSTAAPQPVAMQPVVNGNVTPQTAMQVNQLDEGLVNKICKRLEQAQTSKPDYLEFKQSMTDEAMISSIPAEDARMKIVFKVLSAGSVSFSKETLLKSIDRYIELLGTWCEEMNREVGAGMKEIEQKQTRVEELRSEIEHLSVEAESITNEINELTAKYDTQKQAFENASAFIGKQFTDDRQKIITIL